MQMLAGMGSYLCWENQVRVLNMAFLWYGRETLRGRRASRILASSSRTIRGAGIPYDWSQVCIKAWGAVTPHAFCGCAEIGKLSGLRNRLWVKPHLWVRVSPPAFLNWTYSEKAHDTSTSCAFCFVVVLTERVGGFRGIRGGVDSDGLTEYRYRTEKTLTVWCVIWYCV